MARYSFLLSALLLCALPARGGDWTVIKYQGRDHVTFENIAQFYGLENIQRAGNDLALSSYGRKLQARANSAEFYINGLKFILSYPVVEHDGHLLVSRMDLTKVIEPVLRPSRIASAALVDTIVLDAGHGGHDRGARSPYGCEADFTLDVANRARLALIQDGLRVQMTRASDMFIPLEDRARYANRFRNGLFVSIHFNAGGAGTGLEIYTLAPRGVPSMMADGPRVSDLQPCRGNIRDAENMALACATHAAMVARSGMYDRGIKRARFVVIRDITIPGVLIEGGFQTHPWDARRIATSSYRQLMANCIVEAIRNYRRAVGPQAPTLVVGAQSEATRVAGTTRSGTARRKANGPTVITNSSAE
jgi:N-acetylmuramoyl-L-alanine amidase